MRVRRPSRPQVGHGAFLGAHWTGIVMIVGASVPMLASPVVRGVPILIHGDAGPIFQGQNGLPRTKPPVVLGEKSPYYWAVLPFGRTEGFATSPEVDRSDVHRFLPFHLGSSGRSARGLKSV